MHEQQFTCFYIFIKFECNFNAEKDPWPNFLMKTFLSKNAILGLLNTTHKQQQMYFCAN